MYAKLITATFADWDSRAIDEGYRWCEAALVGPAPSYLRGGVMRWGAQWAAGTDRLDEALALADEALGLARASGDEHDLAWSLSTAALVRGVREEYDVGCALFEESLALTPRSHVWWGYVLHNYGELELTAGNLDRVG